jgi:hypothetical protein
MTIIMTGESLEKTRAYFSHRLLRHILKAISPLEYVAVREKHQVREFYVPVQMRLVISVITNEKVIHGEGMDPNTGLLGSIRDNSQQTPEVATNIEVSHA